MDFVSIRVITDDVARLAGFYEKATGVRATWSTEDFAELGTAHATLAIGSTQTVPLFAPGAARPAGNHTVIIEFLVDDVDGVYQNLAGFVEDFVTEPTTMPWGNRSLLFRDPDGNLVNFFTPVTPAAIEKFARCTPRGRPASVRARSEHDRADRSGLLRRARVGAGLSQAKLAVRAGVVQSVISAYEAGRREPALPTLARLIDATGYDLVVDIQWQPPQLSRLAGPVGQLVRHKRRELVAAAAAHDVRNLRERQRLADIQAAIDAIRSHLQRGDLSDGLVSDAIGMKWACGLIWEHMGFSLGRPRIHPGNPAGRRPTPTGTTN